MKLKCKFDCMESELRCAVIDSGETNEGGDIFEGRDLFVDAVYTLCGQSHFKRENIIQQLALRLTVDNSDGPSAEEFAESLIAEAKRQSDAE